MQKTDAHSAHAAGPSLLPANKSRESLEELDGWQSTSDHKMIYREYIMHDFTAAIDLISQIAAIAQDENHHPDLHLTQYRNLRIGLTTHDVGGLSDKDFTVASRINDLPFDKEHQNLQQGSKAVLGTKKPAQKSKAKSAAKKSKKKSAKTKRAV